MRTADRLAYLSSSESSDEEEDTLLHEHGAVDNFNLEDLKDGFYSPSCTKFGGPIGAVNISFEDINLESEEDLSPKKIRKNKRHPPTAANRKQKPSKKKRKKDTEVDDHRPNSDKEIFSSLHSAKSHFRATKHLHPNQLSSSQKEKNMAKTRKNSAAPERKNVAAPEKEPRTGKRGHESSEEESNPNGAKSRRTEEDLSPSGSVPPPPPRGSVPVPPPARNETVRDWRDVPVLKRTEEEMLASTNISQQKLEQMENQLLVQHEKDKRLPKDDRLALIKRLRRKVMVMGIERKHHGEQTGSKIAKLERDDEKMREEIANLRKVTSDAKATVHANAQEMAKNAELLERIKVVTKTKFWRKHKFIRHDKAQIEATEWVLDYMKLPCMKDPIKRASAIKTYMEPVKKFTFEVKSYVQQEVKKLAMDMQKKNNALPSVNMLEKCLSRDINLDDDAEVNLFCWYWTELLPKIAGSAAWGTKTYYYTTISQATCEDDPDDKVITATDEAMVVLLWDNCYDKWGALHQLETNIGEQPSTDSSNDVQLATIKTKKKQKVIKGKYTSSKMGQSKWGGWADSGILQFNRFHELVNVARKKKTSRNLEKKILQVLRERNNIVCDTDEDQQKWNRAARRRAAKGEAPPAVGEVQLPIANHPKIEAAVDEPWEEESSSEDEEEEKNNNGQDDEDEEDSD